MKILAVDPGLPVLGWVVVERDQDVYHCLAHGTITTRTTESLAARLARIAESVRDLGDGCQCAVVEEAPACAYARSRSGSQLNLDSLRKLQLATGVVVGVLSLRLRVELIPVGTWKGSMTKEQTKEITRMILRQTTGTREMSVHEFDATAMALWFLSR